MAVPSNWPAEIRAAGGEYWQLVAFNDEPFAASYTLKSVDYSGAAFAGAIRAAFEESSPILKSFTITPALLGSDTVVSFTLSEADVQDLRDGTDPGAIEPLFYSIKCTPSGGSKSTHFAGEFKLQGA